MNRIFFVTFSICATGKIKDYIKETNDEAVELLCLKPVSHPSQITIDDKHYKNIEFDYCKMLYM